MNFSVSIGTNSLTVETADERWPDVMSVFTAFLNAFAPHDQAQVDSLAASLKSSTDQLEGAVQAQKG